MSTENGAWHTVSATKCQASCQGLKGQRGLGPALEDSRIQRPLRARAHLGLPCCERTGLFWA